MRRKPHKRRQAYRFAIPLRPHGPTTFDPPPIDALGPWPEGWKGPWPLGPEPPVPTREDNHTLAVANMRMHRQLPKLFDPNTMVLPDARTHYSQLWQAEGRAIEAQKAADAKRKPRKYRAG